MRLRAFFILALLAACAHAQTPPPAAALPDPSALPDAPGRLRIPGADHRQCGPSKWSALCAAGRWTLFSHIDLNVTAPNFSARYELEPTESGELHATYREEIGKTSRGGELVMFGTDTFAYRTREKFEEPGNALDYTLSSPIMMSQLTALLLDLGVIGPPSDVTARKSIAASSDTQYIRTQAPRLAVLYGAPWSMTGNVRPAGADKVGFNLRLRFRPVDRNGNAIAGKTEAITLDGTVSFAPPRAALPDSMDLTGWTVMRAGHDTPLDKAATLKAAREAAAR